MTGSSIFLKRAICPYLAGTSKGMICKSTDNYLKDMNDIDTHMCRNGRYEGCFYYRSHLMQTFLKSELKPSLSATL